MADQQRQDKNVLYAPRFPESWNEQSLYPLAEWLNGMAFKDFGFSLNGKPVVKIAEIKNGISNQTKYTDEKYDEKYLLKKGDMSIPNFTELIFGDLFGNVFNKINNIFSR